MTLRILIVFFVFFTGCSNFLHAQPYFEKNNYINKNNVENTVNTWNFFIKTAARRYNVEQKLIKSIIYVESSGNPYAKSSSNAIGLMQIKPSSAGMEIYRLHGKKGQPSVLELYDPRKNINIGTAYINLLQKKFMGIKNKDIMRGATIVSYVNGASAFLKIFSHNKKEAIEIINTMTMQSFCTYVKKNIQQFKHLVI